MPSVSKKWSPTAARYRQITGFALVALVGIMITGAAVRLTGSGLGCSDWPNCEDDQFVADLEFHALVEFVNRIITGIVSVAAIGAVLASYALSPRRTDLIRWSWGLVAGVLGQIVLGGIVVLSHLNPWLVMGHFALSMVLVWNAVVIHYRAGLAVAGIEPAAAASPRPYARVLTALTMVVVVTGMVVTASGPHSGSRDGETIERLPFEIPQVARVHGISVVVLLTATIVTLWWLARIGAPPTEQWRGRLVLVTLLAQGLIGYVQYFSDVPALLVGFHVAGAIALWITVLWFHLDSSPEPESAAIELAPGAFGTDDRVPVA